MRDLFGAGMVFSLVGAGVLGGVLAFKNQTVVVHQTQVGTLDFDFGGPSQSLLQVHPLLLDRPGSVVRVMDGQLFNTGTWAFLLDPASAVTVTGVTNAGVHPDVRSCQASDFTAKLVDDALGDNQRQVQPGKAAAPFHVDLTFNASAPSSCANQDVSYTIRIVARNLPGPQRFGH